MFIENVATIYQVKYSMRLAGIRWSDTQYVPQEKYFATRKEAEAFRDSYCVGQAVMPVYAVQEEDNKWSVFTKDIELMADDDSEEELNWRGGKHYSLSDQWEKKFSEHPGTLIAVSTCTTSDETELVLVPTVYDDEIEEYVFVDHKGDIYFINDIQEMVELQRTEQDAAVTFINGNVKPETVGSAVSSRRTLADIDKDINALDDRDEKRFDLMHEREDLLAETAYSMPRP
jgi:hypothetical protein